jgi:hypothetical protein
MLLTFSTSIVTKTRTEILHLADRVARDLGSNIYQIVLGNPFSAIHGGMRFCSKIEDWLRVLGTRFHNYAHGDGDGPHSRSCPAIRASYDSVRGARPRHFAC